MRDPRIDPKPGDVIVRGQQVRTVGQPHVTDHRSWVTFTWRKPTTTRPGWRIVHWRTLAQWQRDTAGAVVTRVAGGAA